MHILIADDHKFVRDNLRAAIQQREPEWEISEATDGREAVEQFVIRKPDVTVLDVVMTPVSGVAAAYDIRALDPAAKIVFISGHYTVKEASFVIHLLGGAAFVPKTEAVTLLVPVITRCLTENQRLLM